MTDIMKGLSREQVAFLRATVALNVTDWTPYDSICKHAEALYAGVMHFDRKNIISRVLKPLINIGLIEFREKENEDEDAPGGRGGKAGDIRPTEKFEQQITEPLLMTLYHNAGFAETHEIRSKSLAQIVDLIEKDSDQNRRAKALQWLAIRLCQIFDLEFIGWREEDVETAKGGRVGAMMHAPRPSYSRWQVQCRVGPITMDAVAGEVGIQKATLADTILMVSTQNATISAYQFRRSIERIGALRIIFIVSADLKRIPEDHAAPCNILLNQAQGATRLAQTWRPWGVARQASDTAAPRSILN